MSPRRAKRLTRASIAKTFFPALSKRITKKLAALDALRLPKGDALEAYAAHTERMLSGIAELGTEGVSPFAASLYGLTAELPPSLGPLLERFAFTRDERVQLLTQFVRSENKDRYPVLDLSRQRLTRIPHAIEEVHVEPTNIGTARAPLLYREINLGYNPIATLTRSDFVRLNRYEGIHLIGIKRTKLPAHVSLLTNAVMLNFSWSDLKTLPPEIYGLTRLRALKLNWTWISELSEDIRQLKALGLLELVGLHHAIGARRPCKGECASKASLRNADFHEATRRSAEAGTPTKVSCGSDQASQFVTRLWGTDSKGNEQTEA